MRMPAEWEQHEATWISWPNLDGQAYPDTLNEARPAFLEMVRVIAESEEAWINVREAAEEAWIREHLDSSTLENTRFFPIETNEPWARDHGPSFVLNEARTERAAVHWYFNSWGGKYPPFDADAAAGRTMAEQIGARVIEGGIFFEGGGLEVNGAGLVMVTKACILDDDRNPGLGESEAALILCDRLGVDRVIWVPDVEVTGDDTDGHIDVTTRFTDTNRILISRPTDESAPEFAQLKANADWLAKEFEVDTIPLLPAGFSETYGVPTPRGYANFYLTNGAVLVPTYGEPEDEVAQEILARHFPTRKIAPIDCRYLVEGQGVIHCLTQQVPAVDSR